MTVINQISLLFPTTFASRFPWFLRFISCLVYIGFILISAYCTYGDTCIAGARLVLFFPLPLRRPVHSGAFIARIPFHFYSVTYARLL